MQKTHGYLGRSIQAEGTAKAKSLTTVLVVPKEVRRKEENAQGRE